MAGCYCGFLPRAFKCVVGVLWKGWVHVLLNIKRWLVGQSIRKAGRPPASSVSVSQAFCTGLDMVDSLKLIACLCHKTETERNDKEGVQPMIGKVPQTTLSCDFSWRDKDTHIQL